MKLLNEIQSAPDTRIDLGGRAQWTISMSDLKRYTNKDIRHLPLTKLEIKLEYALRDAEALNAEIARNPPGARLNFFDQWTLNVCERRFARSTREYQQEGGALDAIQLRLFAGSFGALGATT
jgi:hypothetical protein